MHAILLLIPLVKDLKEPPSYLSRWQGDNLAGDIANQAWQHYASGLKGACGWETLQLLCAARTLLGLCNLQEGLQDLLGGAAAIGEEQLVHVEACAAEALPIIQLQPHTAPSDRPARRLKALWLSNL
jgi:hypothetical protein